MQTTDLEMSKDRSEALFNPRVSPRSYKPIQRDEVRPSFLDASSVAEFLGVSRRWVMEHTRSGDLPALRLGKVFRYKMSAIEAWLEGQDAKRQRIPR